MPDPSGELIYRGIPVSPGVSHGKILVLGKSSECLPAYKVSDEDVSKEIQRLEQALIETRRQILEVQRKVGEAMGAHDAGIFDAHLLILEDQTLIDEVSRVIEQEQLNVEKAFHQVAEKYAATLAAIDDEYLRERASDMRDVTARILSNLLNRPHESDLKHLKTPCLVISRDLSPSTTAGLDRKMVLGFVTDVGSKTSHTAIMARALQIPAIVGLKDVSEKLETGIYALLDGYNGVLIIQPTDQTLFEYGQLVRRQSGVREKLLEQRDRPAVTLDGARIVLSANIEQAADTDSVKDFGADGVGLFRTEYMFINRQTLPSEEEQYTSYRKVAADLKPQPVVIRTLDLGGDKFMSHLHIPTEMNPFLGWRAIRFCLQQKDIFRDQLRAILRASVEGNIKVMYPMISCVDELIDANALVEEYKAELRAEGVPFDEDIEIGAMIEIPSAAMIADILARRVKFFSIGTNDLTQYALAVDRLNERIAHLYEPTHPAILRLIQKTVEAARPAGLPVSVCGEMAGDPSVIPLLLGLGVDELSVSPSVIPQIKYLIRRLKMSEAKEIARFALNCESAAETLKRSRALVEKVAPYLFEYRLNADEDLPLA